MNKKHQRKFKHIYFLSWTKFFFLRFPLFPFSFILFSCFLFFLRTTDGLLSSHSLTQLIPPGKARDNRSYWGKLQGGHKVSTAPPGHTLRPSPTRKDSELRTKGGESGVGILIG